jgi:heme exporter protein C
VLGIIGFANVPIVHFSVLWWRGLHQPPSVLRPGTPTIAPILLATLIANVFAFTVAYAWLLRRRVALERARDVAQARLESAT